MGDVGGAISIIMPLDVYQANERESVAQDVLFFAVMLAVCLVVVYVALTYLVTRPLGKIRSGVDEVSEGNLDVRLSYSESSQEMSSRRPSTTWHTNLLMFTQDLKTRWLIGRLSCSRLTRCSSSSVASWKRSTLSWWMRIGTRATSSLW